MDPIENPFSPGAGSPPPELVGRGPILEHARILLGRTRQKKPEKSMLLTGLRGVGKTVLLNEIERLASGDGYRTIAIEAHEEKPLGPLIAPYLRRLLFDLDRIAGAGNKAKRGLAVLRSFIGAFPNSNGSLRNRRAGSLAPSLVEAIENFACSLAQATGRVGENAVGRGSGCGLRRRCSGR